MGNGWWNSVSDHPKLLRSCPTENEIIAKALDSGCFTHSKGTVFGGVEKQAVITKPGVYSTCRKIQTLAAIFPVESVRQINVMAILPQITLIN
jgi:hypothetical protein